MILCGTDQRSEAICSVLDESGMLRPRLINNKQDGSEEKQSACRQRATENSTRRSKMEAQ